MRIQHKADLPTPAEVRKILEEARRHDPEAVEANRWPARFNAEALHGNRHLMAALEVLAEAGAADATAEGTIRVGRLVMRNEANRLELTVYRDDREAARSMEER